MKAIAELSPAVAAAVLILSLVLSSAAQARGGDWADRHKAKKARWEQSQTDDSPTPKGGDE